MTSEVVLSPISEDASAQRRRVYWVVQASMPLGTITLMDQGAIFDWSLPVWSRMTDRAVWGRLREALIATQRAEHINVGRAWSVVDETTSSEQLGTEGGVTFFWLHAASCIRTVPSYFAQRYPDASDGVVLAQLAYEVQAGSVVGSQTTLATTFDATFAVFKNSWGTLLEACSVVIEAGRSVAGAALISLYGDVPLIALLAAQSPLVARALLIAVLDALAELRYPTVNLLLRPGSPYVRLAEALGFEQLALVRQTLLYS